eukprot:TRINITY_DN1208_c0_g1_i3.p1 TRINITY_DN1208_c0_g1~~TRINITY_DN1208_c0_g1_i3.p1  ORF type:complete len:606 (-),score=195.80 TRINITY_DN1208_c0_g1_i3:494-2311(-)
MGCIQSSQQQYSTDVHTPPKIESSMPEPIPPKIESSTPKPHASDDEFAYEIVLKNINEINIAQDIASLTQNLDDSNEEDESEIIEKSVASEEYIANEVSDTEETYSVLGDVEQQDGENILDDCADETTEIIEKKVVSEVSDEIEIEEYIANEISHSEENGSMLDIVEQQDEDSSEESVIDDDVTGLAETIEVNTVAVSEDAKIKECIANEILTCSILNDVEQQEEDSNEESVLGDETTEIIEKNIVLEIANEISETEEHDSVLNDVEQQEDSNEEIYVAAEIIEKNVVSEELKIEEYITSGISETEETDSVLDDVEQQQEDLSETSVIDDDINDTTEIIEKKEVSEEVEIEVRYIANEISETEETDSVLNDIEQQDEEKVLNDRNVPTENVEQISVEGKDNPNGIDGWDEISDCVRVEEISLLSDDGSIASDEKWSVFENKSKISRTSSFLRPPKKVNLDCLSGSASSMKDEPKKKEIWVPVSDAKTNRVYYWEVNSMKTSWRKPDNLETPSIPPSPVTKRKRHPSPKKGNHLVARLSVPIKKVRLREGNFNSISENKTPVVKPFSSKESSLIRTRSFVNHIDRIRRVREVNLVKTKRRLSGEWT